MEMGPKSEHESKHSKVPPPLTPDPTELPNAFTQGEAETAPSTVYCTLLTGLL